MIKLLCLLSALSLAGFHTHAAVPGCEGELNPKAAINFGMVEALSDKNLRALIAYGSRPNGVINWARRNRVPRAQAWILFRAFVTNLLTEKDMGSERLNKLADDVRTTATALIASRSYSGIENFYFECVFTVAPPPSCWADKYDLLNMNGRGLLVGDPLPMIGPEKPLTRMYQTWSRQRPAQGSY